MSDKTLNKPSSTTGMSRVDGRLKVTGGARYAAEFNVKGLAYGVLVTSTITKGTIRSIDSKEAQNAPGVLAVINHLNCPKVPGYPAEPAKAPIKIFYDDQILYNGHPVAMVIADTFERAQYGASLVKVEYNEEKHTTSLKDNLAGAVPPHEDAEYKRGDPDAWATAPFKVEQEYIQPSEVHNPMELHAIVARWDAADKITVWDKTQ